MAQQTIEMRNNVTSGSVKESGRRNDDNDDSGAAALCAQSRIK